MSQFEFPGYKLREQREALGLSLLDAHHETHVPTQYLAHLENGNLSELPATTYTVGFLNTYCQVLDLPAEPFITALRACRRSVAPEPTFFSRTGYSSGAGSPRWMSDVIAWGAVCAILLLGWLSYSVVVKPFAETRQDRVDAGTIEIEPPKRFDQE